MRFYLYKLHFSNNKDYIGLSTNPQRRLIRHKANAKRGDSAPLYVAIRKYGMPKVDILCAGERSYIAGLEIAAIEVFRTRQRRYGYNVSFGGTVSPTLVPATARKISLALSGRPSPTKGIPRPPDVIAKMSAATKGRPGRSGPDNGMTGKTHTAETLAKMSVSQKLRAAVTHTLEWRLKVSAAHKGRKCSVDHRANIGVAARNRSRGSHGHFLPKAMVID